MIRISAFADEIASELDEQIASLAAEGIGTIDLRAAWGTPVLDLDEGQVARLERALAAADIGVAAIATPIGKTPIDGPFGPQVHRFERAITLARRLDARYIRIFSFYPPSAVEGAVDPASYRDEVIRRLRELTARARAADLILVHENEKEIYGDTIACCVDLLESIDDPHLRAAFDPANFIQCAQVPYPDAYEALRPWLGYVHVKDALPDGTVVAAGEGAARWPEILRRLRTDGYDGVFALEPHLASAGQLSGFSGPDLFAHAARSFKALLEAEKWEYR